MKIDRNQEYKIDICLTFDVMFFEAEVPNWVKKGGRRNCKTLISSV